MPTTNGLFSVDYKEVAETTSYKESFSQGNGNEAQRSLMVKWDNRYKFVMDMLGFSTPDFAFGGRLIRRYLPERHPVLSDLFCVHCELTQGIGVPLMDPRTGLIWFVDKKPPVSNFEILAGTAPPGWAVYTCTYRKLPFEVLSDQMVAPQPVPELLRYVERRKTYATESITLPGGSFFYVDGTVGAQRTQIPEGPVKLMGTQTLFYVWHQVPMPGPGRIPKNVETAIENCMGKVNSVVFDDFGGPVQMPRVPGQSILVPVGDPNLLLQTYPGHNAETLLYQGADVQPQENPATGGFNAVITHTMIRRPTGWNKLYRKTINAFQTISSDGTAAGEKPYQSADLNDLFKV